MAAPSPQIVPQNQAQEKRAHVMAQLVQKAFSKPIRALEIGVWYGIGSTNIWMQNLPRNSDLVLLDAWRPYASDADINGTEFRPTYWDYAQMDRLTGDAFLSTYLNVRKHENESDALNISLIRGNSGRILSLFNDSSFDFIYIDADHKYEAVKNDIAKAKSLINKNFGIICGDDLEKHPTKELIELARHHKDRDYIKGDYGYHPGVCLAVAEEFGSVNMVDGFWWICCSKGEFTTALFQPDELSANDPSPQ